MPVLIERLQQKVPEVRFFDEDDGRVYSKGVHHVSSTVRDRLDVGSGCRSVVLDD
jgi:hypothetical protein